LEPLVSALVGNGYQRLSDIIRQSVSFTALCHEPRGRDLFSSLCPTARWNSLLKQSDGTGRCSSGPATLCKHFTHNKWQNGKRCCRNATVCL